MKGYHKDSITEVSRCQSRISPVFTVGGRMVCARGVVDTPQGIVAVYSGRDLTQLEFIYRGRRHMRQWRPGQGILANRSLVTAARKFMTEVCDGWIL